MKIKEDYRIHQETRDYPNRMKLSGTFFVTPNLNVRKKACTLFKQSRHSLINHLVKDTTQLVTELGKV